MVRHFAAAALFVLVALLPPAPALAQLRFKDVIHEVRGGVLAHDVTFWAAGNVERGVALNGEIAFAPSFGVLFGRVRPVLGGSFATHDGTSLVYLDVRFEFTIDRFFFALGVGPAIHTGGLERPVNGRKALGSRVLFHPSFQIGLQLTPQSRVEAYYEHVSNAFLARPNPGLDNIGLRLAHRF
jgi:lipid A 3-O-deacylase